jgi:hypothetical protein
MMPLSSALHARDPPETREGGRRPGSFRVAAFSDRERYRSDRRRPAPLALHLPSRCWLAECGRVLDHRQLSPTRHHPPGPPDGRPSPVANDQDHGDRRPHASPVAAGPRPVALLPVTDGCPHRPMLDDGRRWSTTGDVSCNRGKPSRLAISVVMTRAPNLLVWSPS